MKTHKLDTIRREKAQAAVELALTIPIVLVLILGIIEGGWLLFVYTSLTAAGREAARYGAGVGNISSGTILYNDCDGIKAAALRIGQFDGIKTGDIHIYHDSGPNTTQTEYCTLANPTTSFVQDDRIVVEVNIIYTPISPLVRLPSFPLHSQNAHTVVLGAYVEAVPCDVSKYSVSQNINGKKDIVTISNYSGTATSIVKVLIKWNSTTGQVLNSIDGSLIRGGSLVSPYSSDAAIPFPTTSNPSFTLNFSNTLNSLKTNVIIWLTLAGEGQCIFGQ
jgi:Flp pilus assembly protein TadG